MREVVRQLIQALEQDRPLILCQVVETRGSTPQKAGAIMVVDPGGGQIGTLGGGCVENEVKQKSLRQLDGTAAALHSFVLDHDYAWADGLICGGKMVIVSQPLRGPEPLAYFRAMERAIEQGDGFTEAVVVNPEQMPGAALGDRFLFDGGGRPLATLDGPASSADTDLGRPAAGRPAQAEGRARRRLPAELAARPAGDRGRGARGPGRRRAWRRRPISTSGWSTTVSSTPTPSGSRRPSASSSGRSTRCSARWRSRRGPMP